MRGAAAYAELSEAAIVGDETYEAVRSRKENTPWTNIPHSLMMFEPKSIQP